MRDPAWIAFFVWIGAVATVFFGIALGCWVANLEARRARRRWKQLLPLERMVLGPYTQAPRKGLGSRGRARLGTFAERWPVVHKMLADLPPMKWGGQ